MNTRLAIIVPIFRHSTLAQEAIDCALSLPGDLDPVVIAVDDGCPHPETRRALENWSMVEPQRFHRLHQANRGLSGARNTGIAFALARYPSLEAVYLLDADNRLDAHSLVLFEKLLDEHPEADWFYPNFDMFGLNSNAHNGGPFSVAQMSESNPCEAGSLIRRRMLDTGLRFDETMRSGYEDWEFWLSAARAGFRGLPVKQSFFRYRKRPESMLSGSHGNDGHLRAEIRKRHKWLYDKDNVAQIAAREHPRYVLFEANAAEDVYRFTDPRQLDPFAAQPAMDEIIAASVRPDEKRRPMAWCFVRPGVMDHLSRAGIANSVIWHLHCAAMGSDIAAARITRHHDEYRTLSSQLPLDHPKYRHDWDSISASEKEAARDAYIANQEAQKSILHDADIILMRSATIIAVSNPANEATEQNYERLCQYIDGLRVSVVSVEMEAVPPRSEGYDPVELFKHRAGDLMFARAKDDYVSRLASWRESPKISGPGHLHWILQNQSLGGMPFPILNHEGELHIGFVVPIFLFGGVEKCVVALAAALQRQGVKCHLFVYGAVPMTGTDWLVEPFDTVHQISDPALRDWNGPAYMGTNMATEPNEGFLNNMLAALLSMDAVIVTGSAATFYGFSALRGKGILTLTWEHLLERDFYGRSFGTPYLAVAYEGAIDLILTCSGQLRDWLHGQGVPNQKLLSLPNGPGFPMTPAEVEEDLAERRSRDPSAPLRVGFLGRLDHQKGADHYLEVVSRCKGMPVDFSITGSAVLADSGLTIPDGLETYPAAYGVAELRQAFARIDVLMMPSRDEGLPLTIMEAQRVGVIPIATDVGAVAEAIRDGEDGFLITDTDVVGAMRNTLERLVSDPDLRARVMRNASAGGSQWDRNASDLLAALQPPLEKAARARSRERLDKAG